MMISAILDIVFAGLEPVDQGSVLIVELLNFKKQTLRQNYLDSCTSNQSKSYNNILYNKRKQVRNVRQYFYQVGVSTYRF